MSSARGPNREICAQAANGVEARSRVCCSQLMGTLALRTSSATNALLLRRRYYGRRACALRGGRVPGEGGMAGLPAKLILEKLSIIQLGLLLGLVIGPKFLNPKILEFLRNWQLT